MSRESRPDGHPWSTYVVASSPGWIVAGVVTGVLYRTTDLSALPAVLFLSAWIATDLAMYPRMRRYYTSEPAAARIVGEMGTAVSPLAPRGFARVHGELWQVIVTDPIGSLPLGAAVRVCEIHGLELVVEPI